MRRQITYLKSLALSLVLIAASISTVEAQTFTSTDPPAGIPDDNAGGLTVPIVVPNGTGTISDVNVTLDITHSFVGDLSFTLTSPTGTTSSFFDASPIGFPLISEDLAGTYTFDDDAATSILTQDNAVTIAPGTYIPYNDSTGDLPTALSVFDGEVADGSWVLQIIDSAASDVGTLDFWSLILATTPATVVEPSVEQPAASTPASTPAPVFRRRPAPPVPVLLVDQGAILSAETTGLMVPIVQRQIVQNAANGAIKDLNSRLSRARARTFGDGTVPSVTHGSSLIRFLNFADALNLDYDETITPGDEDTVAVSVHDTLLTDGAMMAVDADPAYRFQVFSEFDYGFYDQDPLNDLIKGFDSDTYTASVGGEFGLFPWLQVGGAFSYLESNTDLGNSYGNVDLDGILLSAYATAFWKNFYLDTLYSYGEFDNDIHRNTLLGRSARGDSESGTHYVDVNLGYIKQITPSLSAGPVLGINYATGDIEGYTERGGGSANLRYADDDFQSAIGRLGGVITWTTGSPVGKITVQGRAGWAHEFTPENDNVSATLVTSPFLLVNGSSANRIGSYTAEASSAHIGEDWLDLGVGLRLDISRQWSLQLDYDGQFFRHDASAHFAGIELSYEWGKTFPSTSAN